MTFSTQPYPMYAAAFQYDTSDPAEYLTAPPQEMTYLAGLVIGWDYSNGYASAVYQLGGCAEAMVYEGGDDGLRVFVGRTQEIADACAQVVYRDLYTRWHKKQLRAA